MSLNRYTNNEDIKSLNVPQFGQHLSEKESTAFKSQIYIPKLSEIDPTSVITEAHIYTLSGDHIDSSYDCKIINDSQPESPFSIFFDAKQPFNKANITRGSFKLVFNVISPLLGDAAQGNKQPLAVQEISPDGTEIKLLLQNSNYIFQLETFKQYIVNMSQLDMANNIIVNFGSNRINKIINFRTDRFQSDVVYIKLLTPVDDSIEQFDTCWFGVELIDSYIDTVILTSKFEGLEVTHVKGPNFRIDVDEYDSTATIFKSWNDLLDSDLVSTQRVIDQTISGSGTATLNIDYTDWENFIFYSSAEERFKNFRYKMQMIESYSMDNGILQGVFPTSGSIYIDSNVTGSIGVSRNIVVNQNRINTILNSFDSFERWLYYNPTGSIFTHDTSGSLTPWPKYQVNNKIQVHSATSSFVQNWYRQNLVSASLYDETNYNSLWWSIPEHILMDPGNSQYQLFVEMIGQHFDNMYMYVKSLTKIHERDEHPERGPSNDLLYHIAKSFGWDLQNTRQLTDLWLYKLGTDNTGSIQYSSDLLVKPHEEQTKQVWRRIINNLPYLLKTKGTTRSIKALMSIYGIPQTLISIKEYGGPGLDSDRPIMIEDVFTYKLNINSGSYIEIPQQEIPATQVGWDKGSVCGLKSTDLYPTYSRTPDTYEFRFSSEQSGSLGAIPIYVQTSGSVVQSALSLVSHRELDVNGSSSYSGSQFYGKLFFESFGSNPQYQYSEYLPLFDGDLWTVRVYNETPISTESLNRIHIARTSDSLYGRIPHESHISMSADVYKINSVYLGGGPQTIYTQLNTNTLSSHSFSQSLQLSGSIQAYKEYFITYNNDTFYNHVQNPLAYHVDSISGSFYTLFRYLPLGSDVQRYDHSTYTLVSSSHADRETNIVSASLFVNFTGDQIAQYTSINETHYSEVPKIGGNTIRSEKIRIEDNSLLFELSPEARSETSEYDDKPIDSNRLAIVFAPSDHINRDVANHMGFEDIDDWISSPALEFGVNYPELNTKRQEYFQKYTQRYDINSFIRILSVYDYTFFEQIKQLVPGRADLIAGILIEPHIFQRPKVQISRLPTVTNPQWDDTIVYETSQSGVFLTYDDELIVTGSTNIDYFYKTSSIEQDNQTTIEYFYKTGSPILDEDFNFQVLYETGSIVKPLTVQDSKIYTYLTASLDYINVGPSNIINQITSSIKYFNEISGGTYSVFTSSVQTVEPYRGFKSGSKETVVTGSNPNPSFTRRVFYYDGFTNYLTDNSLLDNGGLDSPVALDSWTISGGVQFESESIQLDNVETEKLKVGVNIPINEFITQSITTDPDKTYILRFFARPYDTSSVLCKAELEVNGVYVDDRKIYYNINNDLEWVNEYRINFTGSGTDSIKIVAKDSDLFLYNSEIFPFVDSWTEGWLKNENKELKRYSSFEYEEWYYQIADDSSQNNARYKGCKLEGPGINIDSPNTIDGGPVVEIRETNPNSLELNNCSTEGNLRVE